MKTCEKKKFTESEAYRIIIKSFRQREFLGNKNRKEIAYYHCKYCGQYHVTSKEQRNYRELRGL